MAVGSVARLDFRASSPLTQTRCEGTLGPQGRTLFLCVAAYVVAPLLDVPYWGLSLSAPVLVLLMTDTVVRHGFVMVRQFLGWILLSMAIWFGQFASLSANVWVGTPDVVGTASFLWLAKYAFWMAVFLLAAVIVARSDIGYRLAVVLAAAVIGLGLVRAGEGVFFGALGNAKSLLLEQNDYGWAFSTFFPFAVWLVFRGSARWRWTAACGLLALSVAAGINGSRASWAAVVIGSGVTLACVFWWASAGRARSGLLLVLTILGLGLTAMVMPSAWKKPVEERWESLSRLDRDKSYAVRSLMVDKALRLFEGSPWFGVGVGRFRAETVSLELPPVLSTFAASRYQHRSAHNAYLGLLAESGVVGAAPVMALLLILMAGGAWAVRGHTLRGESWAVPIFAGFVAMSAHLALLSGLTNTATWFVFGLVAGLIHRERRTRRVACARGRVRGWA